MLSFDSFPISVSVQSPYQQHIPLLHLWYPPLLLFSLCNSPLFSFVYIVCPVVLVALINTLHISHLFHHTVLCVLYVCVCCVYIYVFICLALFCSSVVNPFFFFFFLLPGSKSFSIPYFACTYASLHSTSHLPPLHSHPSSSPHTATQVTHCMQRGLHSLSPFL